MRQFTAGKNEQDMRLSRFVQRVACQLPASAMYKAFRNRRIKVNGHRAAPDTLLCEGDVIELYLKAAAAGAAGEKKPVFDAGDL